MKLSVLIGTLLLVFGLGNAIVAQTRESPDSAPRRVSSDGPVAVSEVKKLINEADRLVVADSSDNGSKTTRLYESNKRADILAFLSAFDIRIPRGWRLSICGNPDVTFYKGDKVLLSLTNMGAKSVTTSLWEGDYLIGNTNRWLKWFDDRGITGPRAEYKKNIEEAKQNEAALEKWKLAMPKGVRQVWPEVVKQEYLLMYDLAPIRAALMSNYRKNDDRILALLHWYGSGTGKWSGYPAYEQVAGNALMDYSTGEIVAAISIHSLTETQLDGAARFFGGWDFQRLRPNDLNLVPDLIKYRLQQRSSQNSN